MTRSFSALSLCIVLILSWNKLKAQVVNGFPQELSFYVQRNDKQCPIEFDLKSIGNTQFRLEVTKDGQKVREIKKTLNDGSVANFTTLIDVGLHEYSFQLYKGDSLIKSAEKVLCGDAILIYGQSNGLAIAGVDEYENTYNDKWTRNFTLGDAYAERGWYPGKDPFAQVGVLGLALAEHFVKQDQIPIAIINGSVGGQNIDQLSERNSENPLDKSTLYGQFLARVDSAESIESAKAFIWVQGEAETTAGEEAMEAYPEKFDKLYKNIKSDFPPIEHFIVIQNTLMAEGLGEAGIIRNAQSDFMDTYPEITTLASVGQTDSFDGVHYGKAGYERLSWLVFNNLKNPKMASPKLRRVIKEVGLGYIRLIFDEGFKMELFRVRNLWYTQRLIDSFIFINGNNYQLKSVKAVRNEVWLQVKDIKAVETVTYLPSFFSDEFTRHYDGPAIKAKNGYSALTFYNAKVDEVSYRKPKKNLSWIGVASVFETFRAGLIKKILPSKSD